MQVSNIPLPSLAAAVMVVEPGVPPAVTVIVEPEPALMDAIEALAVVQFTVLSAALSGPTVAVSGNVPPGLRFRDVLSRLMDDTRTGLTVNV
jgi:hypothetical protein